MMSGRRTGRGKRKMGSLAEGKEIDRVASARLVKRQPELKLPTELLEMIISKLTLRDNIRASAVCKTWLNAAIFVRKANKPPLLMCLPKSGCIYKFYDPFQHKSYRLELQELRGSRVCYAKDSWLLMCNPGARRSFFFLPYTRQMITLPYKDFRCRPIAFSVAPTAPNCVVLTIEKVGRTEVSISSCRPGETEWTTVTHEGHGLRSGIPHKIVLQNGRFLCFHLPDLLGIYDPVTLDWTVHEVLPPRNMYFPFAHDWSKGNYVVEYNGLILLIVTPYASERPTTYKLESTANLKFEWLKFTISEESTLFTSSLSSMGRVDLLGTMRGKIYFPNVVSRGKQCISYSVQERRYYPSDKLDNWKVMGLLSDNIWFEQPESLSTFK